MFEQFNKNPTLSDCIHTVSYLSRLSRENYLCPLFEQTKVMCVVMFAAPKPCLIFTEHCIIMNMYIFGIVQHDPQITDHITAYIEDECNSA